MSGLPHYTNSQAAIQLYEPVYLNQFEVIINTPAGVQQLPGLNGELILTQQVKSISGMTVDIQPSGPVEQFYKFATRRYAGGEPSQTDMDLTMEFEVNLDDNNSMYVFKILRQCLFYFFTCQPYIHLTRFYRYYILVDFYTFE